MINKKIINEILRVDHAGEYGAQRIYAGQIKFTKNKALKKILKKMISEEKKHLDYFEKEMVSKRIRPTVMYPIWNAGGFALGALTAILGEKYVMACTDSIETVIVEHYKEQLDYLKDSDEKELIKNIRKFVDEEAEHQKVGEQNSQQNDLRLKFFKKIITKLTQTAIRVSEKL